MKTERNRHEKPVAPGDRMKLPQAAYLVTDPNGTHRYRIELPNKEVISKLKSVTGALGVINKPALIFWATKVACQSIEKKLLTLLGKQVEMSGAWIAEIVAEGRKRPDAIKNEAADLGSQVHMAIEAIIKGEEPKASPLIVQPVAEFRAWFAKTNTTIVAQELAVGSVKHRFGGRLDGLGIRDGKWGILDWKTSSGIFCEMALQVAGGYAIAVEEQYPGIKIEWADIVRFAKAEPYGSESKPIINMGVARSAFLHALELGREIETEFFGPASYSTFAKNIPVQKAPTTATPKKTALPLGF